MISCTEFVIAYSELFKFLAKKNGKKEVIKYWEYISDKYVAPRLGEEVKEKGLKGCWDYWNVSLNEEACDFTMTYDEEENLFEIVMEGCPSKGMLNNNQYTNPYPDYCDHCKILYSRVLEKYGIEAFDSDYSKVSECKCIERFRNKLKK